MIAAPALGASVEEAVPLAALPVEEMLDASDLVVVLLLPVVPAVVVVLRVLPIVLLVDFVPESVVEDVEVVEVLDELGADPVTLNC